VLHCNHGVSRSVALGVLYLMYVENLTETQALERIIKVRPVARPNFGFIVQLQEWRERVFSC